jgi:hypothetical protein
MLRLRSYIKFTQQNTKSGLVRNNIFVFPYVHEVSISESFDKLTKTAEITLPRNLKYADLNIYAGENPMIMRGDKVEIKCGYLPNLDLVFTGYVSRVDGQIPVTIKCEDEMFILKQKICPNFSANTTLKNLLKTIGIDKFIKYESINADLGDVRITNASYAFVLQTLYSEFGLFSYIRDGILQVGLATYARGKESAIIFERQIISNELTYLRADDVSVKVKGVLIKKDNTKITKEYGDMDGSLITRFVYNGTEAELDRVCNEALTAQRFTGYHGSFETFLEPMILQGDRVKIVSYKQPERNGVYLVRAVTRSFGVSGGRQKIELDVKL